MARLYPNTSPGLRFFSIMNTMVSKAPVPMDAALSPYTASIENTNDMMAMATASVTGFCRAKPVTMATRNTHKTQMNMPLRLYSNGPGVSTTETQSAPSESVMPKLN